MIGYNFSVAILVDYIALFGIAVGTEVVMVVYLHEALETRLPSGQPLTLDIIQSPNVPTDYWIKSGLSDALGFNIAKVPPLI